MTDDPQAPATKADIQMMMDQIGTYYSKTEARFAELEEKMRLDREEVMRHFDVVAENLIHDFQGAFHDKLDQHEDRIIRLEQHAGIGA